MQDCSISASFARFCTTRTSETQRDFVFFCNGSVRGHAVLEIVVPVYWKSADEFRVLTEFGVGNRVWRLGHRFPLDSCHYSGFSEMSAVVLALLGARSWRYQWNIFLWVLVNVFYWTFLFSVFRAVEDYLYQISLLRTVKLLQKFAPPSGKFKAISAIFTRVSCGRFR